MDGEESTIERQRIKERIEGRGEHREAGEGALMKCQQLERNLAGGNGEE